MKERHFLLKVLSFSGIPRVFSFLFTLFTFPIMLHNMGASEYGIIIYLGSIISIFESFADFGVSSAAGKGVATARVNRPSLIKKEIFSWGKFQLLAALMGLIPMTLATVYLIDLNKQFMISSNIIYLSIAASWVTIMTNFVRAILASTLSFRSLAMVDSFESISRSSSFLIVAFFMPTAAGLATALFFVALLVSILALFTLIITLRKHSKNKLCDEALEIHHELDSKEMVKESLNFLWLRMATRCFVSLPILILGHQFNASIVGVIGTIQRMVDLLTFPFAVIGNALSVRATEMISLGRETIISVWDAITRILSLALIQWTLVFIGTPLFSKMLFGNQQPDNIIIYILSFIILTTSVSSLINQLTNYVGDLKKRNILLTIVSVFQIPVILAGGHFFGMVGAIVAYVLVLIFINIGYLYIAMRSFFPKERYRAKPEIVRFVLCNLLSLGLVVILQTIVIGMDDLKLSKLHLSLLSMVLFFIGICIFVVLNKPLRKIYFTKYFFEFHPASAK